MEGQRQPVPGKVSVPLGLLQAGVVITLRLPRLPFQSTASFRGL